MSSSLFYSDQHKPFYKRHYKTSKFRFYFLLIFEISKFNSSENFAQKQCIKKFEAKIQYFGTDVCRGGYTGSKKKQSLKTLGRVRSGSLKIFFEREPLKICMQSGLAKLYTLRYNVANIIIYVITSLYAVLPITITKLYNVRRTSAKILKFYIIEIVKLI